MPMFPKQIPFLFATLALFSLHGMAQTPQQSFPSLIALKPEHAKAIPKKPYPSLSVQDLSLLKTLWVAVGPSDEPPYPVNGTGELLKLSLERARELDAEEDLIVVADVNEKGQVTEVVPRRYQDDQLLKSVKWILVDTPFKPALCSGKPCKSTFPLIVRTR